MPPSQPSARPQVAAPKAAESAAAAVAAASAPVPAKPAPAPMAEPAVPLAARPPAPPAPAPRKPSRASSGALSALLLAALLAGAGAATSWYELSVEAQVRDLAEEVAASVVPDQALVPSAVKGARAENATLAAALAPRFAPRGEPVAALRAIEAAAKANGVASSFTRVEVAGWDGTPEGLGADDAAVSATSTPYAVVAAGVGAAGTWPKVLAFGAALERLPLAARVDALRLASSVDAAGKPAWTLEAQVSVAAK